MSLENAILELAKSITFCAEVIRGVNRPNIIEQEVKNTDISFETPKVPKKSKKSESIISVDTATPEGDKNVESKIEIRESEIVNISVVNSPKVEIPVISSDDSSDLSKTITSEMCKNLAKEKMSAGIDRTKIKNLVTEMGAESIADLTERNLVEFYTKLQDLK